MEIKSREVRCNTDVELREPTLAHKILVARMSQQEPVIDVNGYIITKNIREREFN
jgi:hypothetical protein